MLLFLISFVLVLVSSYFITSIIAPKKSVLGLIYLALISFAQIVFTFEILSLFSAIKQFWVLGINILFFTGSIYAWNKFSRPFWSLDCGTFFNRLKNSFKLDKSLIWLFVGFLIFIFSALILCLMLPVTNADAQGYHVVRSLFWVTQGSLQHFEVSDIRALCLPINSEILYSWVFLFLKKDFALGLFAFSGYVIAMLSTYNILGNLGYSTRKKLWVIFILSSFPCVLVQPSGTETDLIIAALISSSIFLFWYALKNNKTMPVFMASLAYALAIGTKTTSIIAIPGAGLFLLWLCYYYKKYKPLGYFLGFGLINLLIFSSYNYILNFIQFSNLMGPESFIVVSKNYYGIKGMFAGFIKNLFLLFDFTGYTWSKFFGPHILSLKASILSFFDISYVKDGLFTNLGQINNTLLEPLMGIGVIGLFTFIPCLLFSLVRPLFKLKSRKNKFILAFALLFIVNILSMSYLLAYMDYSVRFIMTYVVLAAPVLGYSYFSNRNPLKYILIYFALFDLIFVSTHLWARPLVNIKKIWNLHPSITYVRDVALCKTYVKYPEYTNELCPVSRELTKHFMPENKILAFIDSSDYLYMLKILEFYGYKIDFRNMEYSGKIDFDKYNILIVSNEGQVSTLISRYDRFKSKDANSASVNCQYIPNSSLNNIISEETKRPYETMCKFSDDFLKLNHFHILAKAGVINPTLKDFNYYLIYASTKHPPKLKSGKFSK